MINDYNIQDGYYMDPSKVTSVSLSLYFLNHDLYVSVYKVYLQQYSYSLNILKMMRQINQDTRHVQCHSKQKEITKYCKTV